MKKALGLLAVGTITVLVCGCGTVNVTSDPVGATVHKAALIGKSSKVQGTTPCSYRHSFLAKEKAFVVWPDGTKSTPCEHIRMFFLVPEKINFHFEQ